MTSDVPDRRTAVDHLPAGEPFDVRRCVRCGCTDLQACAGGCWWITAEGDEYDVCSACATTEEMERWDDEWCGLDEDDA